MVAISNIKKPFGYDEEDLISDSMVDLLTILLLVFLLIIIKLTLTGFKIQFLSKDNTYSGGIIRPSFILTPITFDNNNIINIHKQDRENFEKDEVLLGVYDNSFSGLLSFIDPGEMYIGNKKEAVLHLKIEEDPTAMEFIIGSDNRTSGMAVLDKNILEDIIASVWDGYKLTDFGSIVFNDKFNITRRPKLYYESLIKDKRRYVVIGDFTIEVTEGLSYNDEFIFSNLATSMMDFVYLGEFSEKKRVDFFRKYEGETSVTYYYKWNNSKDEITMLPPFVKYKNIRKEYIKNYASDNIEPPLWIREGFLEKIGANLKVVNEDTEGRLKVE